MLAARVVNQEPWLLSGQRLHWDSLGEETVSFTDWSTAGLEGVVGEAECVGWRAGPLSGQTLSSSRSFLL